jgi:hypothetical protein
VDVIYLPGWLLQLAFEERLLIGVDEIARFYSARLPPLIFFIIIGQSRLEKKMAEDRKTHNYTSGISEEAPASGTSVAQGASDPGFPPSCFATLAHVHIGQIVKRL